MATVAPKPKVVAPANSPICDADQAETVPAKNPGYHFDMFSIVWLAFVHAAAIAAFWFFSWEGLVLTVALHWLTGGMGICFGFHRYFTHGSFRTFPAVRYVLAILGGLAGEGSAVDWVANHRKHHALSDQEGDPHSPHDGAWWSHVLWIGVTANDHNQEKHLQRWVPDLVKDKTLRFIGNMFIPFHFLLGFMLIGLGYAYGAWAYSMPWYYAMSFVTWGMFARLVFVLHSTWFVNSASHMWGYRNYETTDDSRNNWWVAILTYGEGWHNNHHAYPRMANHGHRWWEFDMTFWAVRICQRLGLVWDVVDYRHRNDQTTAA